MSSRPRNIRHTSFPAATRKAGMAFQGVQRVLGQGKGLTTGAGGTQTFKRRPLPRARRRRRCRR